MVSAWVRPVSYTHLDVYKRQFTGYTDTAVIAGKLHNTECMSYGPGSLQYAHKPDEFVEIWDIIRCEKVINHLVMSLCGEK